jgi:type II secretory pathway pseudopilin PulG
MTTDPNDLLLGLAILGILNAAVTSILVAERRRRAKMSERERRLEDEESRYDMGIW